MTTQHTHHEPSDVDTSVVKYSSAPETTVDPTKSETTTSADNNVEATAPSLELTASDNEQEEDAHTEILAPHETSVVNVSEEQTVQNTITDPLSGDVTVQETITTITTTSSTVEETNNETISEIPPTQEVLTEIVSETSTMLEDSTPALQQENYSETTQPDTITSLISETQESAGNVESVKTFTYTEVIPLIETKEEEVRPFTDFIEEFRQAEAARLQASLQDSQTETFALLSPVVTNFTTSPGEIETKSAETQEVNVIAIEETLTQEVSTTLSVEERQVQEGSSTVIENPQEEKTTEVARPTPPERAVSPLLRPARLRVPRHSVGRHQREEAQPDTQIQPAKEQATPTTPVEPATTVETPRPARRYRFDRPAVPNLAKGSTQLTTTAPAKQKQAEETHTITPTRPEPPQPAIEQLTVQPVVEPPTRKQAVQETLPIENPVVPPPVQESSRRRHGHKEQQATPAPATPVTPPAPIETAAIIIAEPTKKQEEIAPEDLPPLEYSELQKASSRRRRRHRSSGNASTASTTPATPIPAPAAPVTTPTLSSLPAIPPSPSTTNGNYTIVSGYTVNQMNQGNDMTGPFMGPEPSPARGSIFTRDGRTTRAELQRTQTSSTSYPARTNENGLTSASLTHLANIVSQSFQTQTDRMVAELRRSSQSPASVSVTLPPFPSTERVGVFVDVANLLYSARTLRIAVDFGKLLDFLRGNRRLIRAHAYCPTSPQPGDEQTFLQAVKGLGYRITTKNYKTFSSGAKKADLDLDLCMDVVRLVDGGAVDCIVLVSGDSDFMPMLDYCSDHGVRVEVAAFDEAMSATLRQSCDLFVNLSLLEEIRA